MGNYYIFTFGYGRENEGKYVKVYSDTYGDARDKMISKYSLDWAFQYSADEWDDWVKNKPSFIPLETMLEEI